MKSIDVFDFDPVEELIRVPYVRVRFDIFHEFTKN